MKKVREIKRRPNPDAIQTVRRICAQVERGDIMSVGFVLVKRGGNVATGWDAAPGDNHKLISGAATLSYRVVKAAEESAA